MGGVCRPGGKMVTKILAKIKEYEGFIEEMYEAEEYQELGEAQGYIAALNWVLEEANSNERN